MARHGIWGLLICLAACGQASPLPDMQPGESGRVVRVIDGDALVLDTGLSVRLVSIEAPALYPKDRPAEPHAAESARLLEDLSLGRRVRLYYPGLTRDRYDRALAHLVTRDGSGPDLWLNQEMVRRGGAWVRLYPDTAARGDMLLATEQDARGQKIGVWGQAAYRERSADQIGPDHRGFALVRASLGPALPVPTDTRYPPACLRTLEGADLRLSVRRAAQTVCGLADGTKLLIRGYVADGALDLTYSRHAQSIGAD